MAKETKTEVTAEDIENELRALSIEEEAQGERYYARKFKKLYVVVRKALVICNKNRKNIGNEEAFNLAVKLIREEIDN